MYIDSHVHLRDFNQTHKETIRHGLEVARDSCVDAIFDMPNTDPPIMTRELVEQRLKIAKDSDVPEVFYGLYMGLTSNPEQIKQAVQIYRDFFPNIVGMKLYAGHSVGDLGVVNEEDQRTVYETLTKEGYEGFLAIHCEKESHIHRYIFNSLRSITHCHAQPEKAEVESVKDQLRFAREYGFKGKMHVAHISSPGAVELIYQAKMEGRDISSGICPHHFIYDWSQMSQEKGILWKMNPPLREPESRDKIFDMLKQGKIDWIETDHAPHTLNEKIKKPFMSGIPGIPWWPMFQEFLRQNEFSDSQVERLVFSNVVERFGIDIKKRKAKIIDRRQDYPFDPYKKFSDELNWERGSK
tara:strand:- start:1989 stop:3050 length:1062 start_codon:yes stop_codon:yes gene_type:complete